MKNERSALPAFAKAQQALWPLLQSPLSDVRNDAAKNLVSLEQSYTRIFSAENPIRRITPAVTSVPVPARSRTAQLLLEAVHNGQVTEPIVVEWSKKRLSPG